MHLRCLPVILNLHGFMGLPCCRARHVGSERLVVSLGESMVLSCLHLHATL